MTDAVTDSPLNPLSTGTWRAFVIPLDGDSLMGSGNHTVLQPYFRFTSNETGYEILQSVNGMMSGVITTGAAAAGTTFYFDAPITLYSPDDHKMHFAQYPDTFGLDIDFTSPMVLADDWLCTESGPVELITFWFSAKNDWFDVDGDLMAQISNIHVSIHDNIPDPDGPEGPLFSMPGDTLWTRNYLPYSPWVSFKEFYADGDQGWYDPMTETYIPHDHTHIYECTISNIWDAFEQIEGEIYWLDISITSVETPPVDSLLGWKTAAIKWYPGDHAGRRFEDDGVWGDFPLPAWTDLRYPAGPDSGESLDLAFLIGNHWHDRCCDGRWGPREWCGKDCYDDKECTDLTHDCEVGLVDFALFAESYASPTLNPTGDINGDGFVDLIDLSLFAAHFGHTVPNCLPDDAMWQGPPDWSLHVSFSANPAIIQNSTIAPPMTPVNVYVVADDIIPPTNFDIDALEFGMTATGTGFWMTDFIVTSPFNIKLGSSLDQMSIASPVPVSPPVVVGYATYLYTGDPYVDINLHANTWNGELRSVSIGDTAYTDFAVVAAGYIGSSPTSGTDGDIDVPVYRLLPSSPNPVEGATLIRYELAKSDRVHLAIYDVAGQQVKTLVDLPVQKAGPHSVRWDGLDNNGRTVAPGVYFYRLETDRFEETKSLTVIR
jgi:hypothetical protein